MRILFTTDKTGCPIILNFWVKGCIDTLKLHPNSVATKVENR